MADVQQPMRLLFLVLHLCDTPNCPWVEWAAEIAGLGC